jgi:F-type H+-transporting ATPase subunit delta
MSNQLIAKKIAKPYAQAFLQSSLSLIKSDNLDGFYNLIVETQTVLSFLINSNDGKNEPTELQTFLSSPVYTLDAKKRILNECLGTNISKSTLKFINYIVDKKRGAYLSAIMETFQELMYEFLCIKFVEVTTVVELTQQQEEKIKEKVIEMLGPALIEPSVHMPKVKLVVKIDQSILGGVIIKVDSKIIDLSVREELRQLGKNLNVAV